jgi:hypothetical protein
MTRVAWLAAHRLSQDRPWETEGVSRATYYRRRSVDGTAAGWPRQSQTRRAEREPRKRETGTVPCKKIVGGHATCLTGVRHARTVQIMLTPQGLSWCNGDAADAARWMPL